MKRYTKYLRVRNTNITYESLQEYSTRCFLSPYKIVSNTNKLLTIIHFGWAACFVYVGFIPISVGLFVSVSSTLGSFPLCSKMGLLALRQSAKLFSGLIRCICFNSRVDHQSGEPPEELSKSNVSATVTTVPKAAVNYVKVCTTCFCPLDGEVETLTCAQCGFCTALFGVTVACKQEDLEYF